MSDMSTLPIPHETAPVRRTRQALQALRTPGWMFAAHFLGLAFESVDAKTARVSMPIGAHCTDERGAVSIAALSVLADVALAAALRGTVGASARLATLTTRLSFSALPQSGNLLAVAHRQLQVDALSMPSAVATLEIFGDTGLCCTGEASFAVLDNRLGTATHPMPRHSTIDDLEPLPENLLTDDEQTVLAQACAAASRSEPAPGFLESFWQLLPSTDAQGAFCRLSSGLHVSNRVGHLQGGVLLGLVATTSAAAVPSGWHLLDLSSQYIEAGKGPWAMARARIIRLGKNSAYVECCVHDAKGNLIVRAQATFIRTTAMQTAT